MTDHPDPWIAKVQAITESILDCIERSRIGSIGSAGNTYLAQIGVEDVRRWRSELAALLTERAASPLTCSWCHKPDAGPTVSDSDEAAGICWACAQRIATFLKPASPADPPPLPREEA